jgi:hypothetical protein
LLEESLSIRSFLPPPLESRWRQVQEKSDFFISTPKYNFGALTIVGFTPAGDFFEENGKVGA